VDPISRPTNSIDETLTGQIEPFDSFWEGPEDIEAGYPRLGRFYEKNYLRHFPTDRESAILVISCGPGYFVNMLNQNGYQNVLGIDSMESKISYARQKGLNCRVDRAFNHLQAHPRSYDVVVCEQELNHLTKKEMIDFLICARHSLRRHGTLIVHGLNGANPITGSDAAAQNFDHYNTLTEASLQQVLRHTGYEGIEVFGLNLYVFYRNPANWIALAVASSLTIVFRALFVLYGKPNKIFTKKIGAVCRPSSI
jgi:2-polyprenyl-3-methyl-5-hydroxy-6-metoxy-1,4-benzoquinol methylase